MTVFSVKDLAKHKPDKAGEILFSGINFSLNNGDILAIKGPSGAGKTTFVKCLAELIPFEAGTLTLDNKSPEQMGIPNWRSSVMYVPQRPAILPGTPRQFFTKVHGFASNKTKKVEDPVEIGKEWLVHVDLWDKEWSTLSGGESQRISMAIALSCKPKVLLLDEPTSALDPKTVKLVEKTILKRHHFDAAVWITHDPEQCDRVATKVLTLSGLPNQYELVDILTGQITSDLNQGPDEIIIQS